MKTKDQTVAFLLIMITFSVGTIAGCSSTGAQRSQNATITMQTIDTDIKSTIKMLDATEASLNELMRPGQSDVKTAFDLFSDNVSKMETMEKQFVKHSDEMKKRGKEYFEEWQKEGNEYKNEQLRTLSEQRRTELSAIYDQIAINSYGVNDAFKTYVSDITGIRTFLSNDLTSRGIESVASIARKVNYDGNDLKNSLQKIQSAIDKVREAMSLSSR